MCKSVSSLILIAAVLCTGCQPTRRAEDLIAAEIQQDLNQNKQQVFRSIHPMGFAKSATVHDVTILWKHGQSTNRLQDIQEITVRYTIYWEGPITKDGYTKVSETFDTETQRYTRGSILATNGITNKEAGETIGVIGGAILHNYLNNKDNN